MRRSVRLFYLNYFLKRWNGCILVSVVIRSPISITVFLNRTELPEVEAYIQKSKFPKRLRLALYVTAISDEKDCVYHFVDDELVCLEQTVYPLNRLRNIAIDNTRTSHFILLDMDMWPASNLHNIFYLIENAYPVLMTLPPSYYANPYNVMIIPAFFLSKNVLDSEYCKDLKSCVESWGKQIHYET